MSVYALGLYWGRCQVGDLVEHWSSISLWKRRPFKELCHMAFRETRPSPERYVTMVVIKHDTTDFLLAMCHNPHDAKDQSRLVTLVAGDYPRSALSMLLLSAFTSIRDAVALDGLQDVSLRHLPMPALNPPLQALWRSLRCPPSSTLSISAVKASLEETKAVMFDVIDKVLERGVKIEHLVQKSEDLSESSKMFYQRARSMSYRCCVVS